MARGWSSKLADREWAGIEPLLPVSGGGGDATIDRGEARFCGNDVYEKAVEEVCGTKFSIIVLIMIRK